MDSRIPVGSFVPPQSITQNHGLQHSQQSNARQNVQNGAAQILPSSTYTQTGSDSHAFFTQRRPDSVSTMSSLPMHRGDTQSPQQLRAMVAEALTPLGLEPETLQEMTVHSYYEPNNGSTTTLELAHHSDSSVHDVDYVVLIDDNGGVSCTGVDGTGVAEVVLPPGQVNHLTELILAYQGAMLEEPDIDAAVPHTHASSIQSQSSTDAMDALQSSHPNASLAMPSNLTDAANTDLAQSLTNTSTAKAGATHMSNATSSIAPEIKTKHTTSITATPTQPGHKKVSAYKTLLNEIKTLTDGGKWIHSGQKQNFGSAQVKLSPKHENVRELLYQLHPGKTAADANSRSMFSKWLEFLQEPTLNGTSLDRKYCRIVNGELQASLQPFEDAVQVNKDALFNKLDDAKCARMADFFVASIKHASRTEAKYKMRKILPYADQIRTLVAKVKKNETLVPDDFRVAVKAAPDSGIAGMVNFNGVNNRPK